MEGVRWCCPYCCCWVPEARLDGHMEPCARRHAVLQTALGYAPCARDATHVLLPADAAPHAARCGTACPAPARAPAASPTLPCRSCGAAVPLAARRCAWCRVLRPWAFVPRPPRAAPPPVATDERLARAVALVRDAVSASPDEFPALYRALTDPACEAPPVSVQQEQQEEQQEAAAEEDGDDDENKVEEAEEDEDDPCASAKKRRRDALDDPLRAPWLLEVIHRADMRNVRAREAQAQQRQE